MPVLKDPGRRTSVPAQLAGSSPLGRQQTRQLPTVIVAQAAALAGWPAGWLAGWPAGD